MEQEKKEIKEHKEKILNEMRKNQDKKELDLKIDANMMLIQKTFEEWLRNKGKKRGRKGKKKKR